MLPVDHPFLPLSSSRQLYNLASQGRNNSLSAGFKKEVLSLPKAELLGLDFLTALLLPSYCAVLLCTSQKLVYDLFFLGRKEGEMSP